jgi:hypothetical protein
VHPPRAVARWLQQELGLPQACPLAQVKVQAQVTSSPQVQVQQALQVQVQVTLFGETQRPGAGRSLIGSRKTQSRRRRPMEPRVHGLWWDGRQGWGPGRQALPRGRGPGAEIPWRVMGHLHARHVVKRRQSTTLRWASRTEQRGHSSETCPHHRKHLRGGSRAAHKLDMCVTTGGGAYECATNSPSSGQRRRQRPMHTTATSEPHAHKGDIRAPSQKRDVSTP